MTALLTDDATREAARLHVSDYCDVDQGAMEPETKAWAEGIYRAGARFAQGIYEARLAEDAKVRAQLVDELKKAQILLRLLTVQQVIESGGPFIEASGLNPWCLNEGLSTGNERLSTWQIDAALAAAKVLE